MLRFSKESAAADRNLPSNKEQQWLTRSSGARSFFRSDHRNGYVLVGDGLVQLVGSGSVPEGKSTEGARFFRVSRRHRRRSQPQQLGQEDCPIWHSEAPAPRAHRWRAHIAPRAIRQLLYRPRGRWSVTPAGPQARGPASDHRRSLLSYWAAL